MSKTTYLADFAASVVLIVSLTRPTALLAMGLLRTPTPIQPYIPPGFAARERVGGPRVRFSSI